MLPHPCINHHKTTTSPVPSALYSAPTKSPRSSLAGTTATAGHRAYCTVNEASLRWKAAQQRESQRNVSRRAGIRAAVGEAACVGG